jgi:hypothetical protein
MKMLALSLSLSLFLFLSLSKVYLHESVLWSL